MKKTYIAPISFYINHIAESPLMSISTDPIIDVDGPEVGGNGSEPIEELTRHQENYWMD